MNYRQALAFLNDFINYERVPEPRFHTTPDDIARFRKLLTELGDPHRKYAVIHVVGTKGKGSTAAMLASILASSGYTVGLYSSPHLVSVRERIRVHGREIGKRDFAALISELRSFSPEFGDPRRLAYRTVFEYLTAAAFLYFMRRGVQVAVVEAGLGAKLDATIVVDPMVSVITPIGLDHTVVLGDTPTLIAEDKSYVIKPGTPAVTAPQSPEVMAVLKRRAESVGADLTSASLPPGTVVTKTGLFGTELEVTVEGKRRNLRLALPGRFQIENLSVVLKVAGILSSRGYNIEWKGIAQGLSGVRWPGRLQFLGPRLKTILDGSHNALAVTALVNALKELAPDKRWRVVFGVLRDKPAAEMLEMLAPLAQGFYLAPIGFPKTLEITKLAETAGRLSLPHRTFVSVPEAWERARRDLQPGEMVLATGSLYLVGEILRRVRGLPPPPPDGRIDDSV